MRNRGDVVRVRTPEGVCFSFQLASPVYRFFALVFDLLCIMVAASALGTVLGVLRVVSPGTALAASIIAYFLVATGYPMVTEWFWRGQTVGKRLFRLRVVDEQGFQLNGVQVILRNLLRYVDMLPLFYLVGGVSAFLSSRAQRLGDIAAGTIVIWTPSVTEPDIDQIMPDKYNSFLDYPLQQARLRKRVHPEAAMIALDAVVRCDTFEPKARLALFRELADYLRTCAAFPETVTRGLSDEQYVRNAIGVLFRDSARGVARKIESAARHAS
ncbi:MAG: RDD family protein [Candidatus Pacebacteria bacterium]|nr:RDD family protein [Candidatus Paceibacterota bacterium]